MPFRERYYGRVYPIRVPLPRISSRLRVSEQYHGLILACIDKSADSWGISWLVEFSIKNKIPFLQNGTPWARNTHRALCNDSPRICKPRQLLGCLQRPRPILDSKNLRWEVFPFLDWKQNLVCQCIFHQGPMDHDWVDAAVRFLHQFGG